MDQIVRNGNWLACIAIVCWPVISALMYRFLSFSRATIWTILGAFLFLPSMTQIKFPMVPALDDRTVPGLCAFVASLTIGAMYKKRAVSIDLQNILVAISVLSPIVTAVLNTDPIDTGEVILPGVGLYDGVSSAISALFSLVVFFVSRYFLSTKSDVLELLVATSCGGLVYSILMLFEIRFSPQLANWIYQAFRPGGFIVEFRYGGYRPVVFLHNGLEASFFLSTAVIASIALYRARNAAKSSFAAISGYLGVVLILCKSAGALIYGVTLGAAVRWLKPKSQLRIATILALISLTYPFSRLADVFPTSTLVEIAKSVNADRAQSLEFRFDQEDALLAHARERLMFGWGRYGRNRLINEYGKDVSVTDGQWIITLGQFGLVGFIAQFGALGLSILRVMRLARRVGESGEALLLSALSLIMAAAMIEQLPNASISSWTWLLAGVLAGRADRLQNRTAYPTTQHISGRKLSMMNGPQ